MDLLISITFKTDRPNLNRNEKTNYAYHTMAGRYLSIGPNSCGQTTIDLPEGFDVESLPADVTLKFTYGDYQASYKYDAAKNQVTSTTHFNLNNQVIPAAKYAEMQAYLENIAKAQNRKLVIKRKG